MKAHDYAMTLAKINFETQLITPRSNDILYYINNKIKEFIPNAIIYSAGSSRTKTNVLGQSDIDILLALPYPAEGISVDDIHTYLLSLAGYLRVTLKLNLDGYFDPPAFVVEDLVFNDTTKIEITAALTTKVSGGNEYDFFILNRFCNGIIITNPDRRVKVAKFLNQITDNYFSFVTILIKIISKRLKLNLPSFAIESFLYFWFRDKYNADCKMNVMKESNDLDFTYDPYKYMGILDLYYMTFNALLSIAKELASYCSQNTMFIMENPFIEGFGEYVQFCETANEQEIISNELFGYSDFMYSFMSKDKVNETEMDFVFLGDDIKESPYKKNNKSFYALRELYAPILKDVRQLIWNNCKYILYNKSLSPYHFLYFELMLCLKDKVDTLRFLFSTAQVKECNLAFESIFRYSVDIVRLCSSVSIREMMFGMKNEKKISDLAFKLLELFSMFITEDSLENSRHNIIASCLPRRDYPDPYIMEWEGDSKEFDSCVFKSQSIYKKYLHNENWNNRFVDIIP